MKPEEAIQYLKVIMENKTNQLIIAAFKLATESIEKQIPKKPILIPHWSPSKKDYKCPVCSGDVNRQWEYEHYDDSMIGEEQYEHCPDCGQKINWSDEE